MPKESKVVPTVLSNETLCDYNLALECLYGSINRIVKDFKCKYDIDIASFIETRIKSNDSIVNKLRKSNLPLTESSVSEKLHDIVGVRIVCANLLDLQLIIQLLQKSTAFKIINEKDYISHPKENGYRSYHLIVEIPVDLVDGLKIFTCEIQVRTLFMHAWSKFEHDKIYKKDNVDENLQKLLKHHSDDLFDKDCEMMKHLIETDVNENSIATNAGEFVQQLIKSKRGI